MAKLNVAKDYSHIQTHEGARAFAHMTPEEELRRSVMSCMLWEDEFYEDGETIAERISANAKRVHPFSLANITIEARKQANLRHVPLLLLCALIERSEECQKIGMTPSISNVIAETISRADELSELLAIYWRNGKRPLAAQLKKGLAKAFQKFDAYQLAKYNRDGAIKLRDVLFLCHAKPKDAEQEQLWNKLILGTLPSPDTWETGLSSGADKKETFERLLREEKLGYMALLRNLRNMHESGVNSALVESAIRARKGAQKVLPFRFLSAVTHAPMYATALGEAMLQSIEDLPSFSGTTVVCVDTSGSMQSPVSAKSQISCCDAAATLASMIRGQVRLLIFGSFVKEIPFYPGLAGVDKIRASIGSVGHGTDIDAAVRDANAIGADRIVVITDEQSHTSVRAPSAKYAYVVNVASAIHGIGYGPWTHVDGFSESTIRWMREFEEQSVS